MNNYIEVEQKRKSEKKVGIYYYKGGGENGVRGGGMEVIGWVYNVVRGLKGEGYRVKNVGG